MSNTLPPTKMVSREADGFLYGILSHCALKTKDSSTPRSGGTGQSIILSNIHILKTEVKCPCGRRIK